MSKHYELNGDGDLWFDGGVKPYIGTLVEFVKVCKSGLFQVRAHDGQLISVPKRNLTDIQCSPDRDSSPRS